MRKKNNGLIIGILVVTVLCFAIFGVLLAKGAISFNGNEKNLKETSNNENDFIISYKEETEEFKNSNGKVVITNKRNLPVISSNNENITNNIVEYLTNVSNKDWKQLEDTSKGYAENFPDDYSVGVDYLFRTILNNENILTIGYEMSGSMGGVSWLGNWGYNFNKEDGKLLELNDIINESSAKENLYQYIVDNIKNSQYYDVLWEGDDITPNWKVSVKDNMFKTGNWYFTDKGIMVTFDKYLLGPGSTGVVTVEIPFSELNQYLKDEYKRK